MMYVLSTVKIQSKDLKQLANLQQKTLVSSLFVKQLLSEHHKLNLN